MAYRTYINGHEWLGNNECPKEIFDELERQGCPFDEEYCIREPFKVKDLTGLVKATEKYIKRKIKDNNDVANFSKEILNDNYFADSLTLYLQQLRDNAYIFVGVKLLEYIGKQEVDYTINHKWNRKGELNIEYELIYDGKCEFTAY